MRELVLVTHPEATHVVDGLVGGWYDADLTERGAAQAQQVAAAVGPVDAVFSSDLREQSYGVAGGHPPGTFPYVRPGPDDDPLTHHDGVEGSETRLQVATRVQAAVARIEAAGHERAVVVGHGGASTYVVTAWLGVPVEHVGRVRLAFSPGSITRLERSSSGDRRLRSLAEVAHLDR